MGLAGVAGRASGVKHDLRVDYPIPPYQQAGVRIALHTRGEVLIALETADANRIHRAHAHDPSWQNWPAIERAVIGNIVPDFPLINKSFNLSYSGQDL